MNAHLSYVAGRTYVFQDFVWKAEYYPWPESKMYENPPRTPLNALISGPAAGGAWDPEDPAPRAVSENWFEVVCPWAERTKINTRDVKPAVWHAPGDEVLAHWAKALRDSPASCLEIVGASWEEDMFSQVFDLWIFGSTRILSLWDEFSKSPVSRLLGTSPIVKSAVDANEYLFLPRGPRPAYPITQDPFERMMAMHVRRGDFGEACYRLAYHNATFYSWNLLPILPDTFNVPPELVWNTTAYTQTYLDRCLADAPAIAKKARDSRDAYVEAGNSTEKYKRTLDVMYLLTNAKGEWLDMLKGLLRKDGWHTIVTSADLELDVEQTDVNMAVDMDIARKAAVFIGNGVSVLILLLLLITLLHDTHDCIYV